MGLSTDLSGNGAAETTKRTVRKPTASSISTAQRQKRSKGPLLIGTVIGLLLGMAVGVVVMKQRQNSREVVVAVNGSIIDQKAFYRNLEGAAGGQVIRKMVGDELQIQFAQKMGVAPTEADVQAKYDAAASKPGFNKDAMKSKDAAEDFKRSLRVNLSRTNVLTKGMTVNDADLRSFYNLNVDHKNPRALFYAPEKVTLQVIATPSEADIRKAEQDLLKGTPFATVAKNYSRDGSKDRAGLLPTIQRSLPGTSKLGAMEDTVFGLKIGAMAGPRQFGKAWWIIKCLDKKPETTQTFESVKDECRTGALLTKGLPANGKKAEDDFKQFQQVSHVQAFWEKYTAATNVK